MSYNKELDETIRTIEILNKETEEKIIGEVKQYDKGIKKIQLSRKYGSNFKKFGRFLKSDIDIVIKIIKELENDL